MHSISNVQTAPAIQAEDMMERIKMSFNSINGREIWRKRMMPNGKRPNAETGETGMMEYNWQSLLILAANPFAGAESVPIDLGEVYKDLHKTIYNCEDLDEDELTLLKADYKHVGNWASTVLNGATIIQEATTKASRLVAFSTDFTMYVELVHPDVLGYRQPFVDSKCQLLS